MLAYSGGLDTSVSVKWLQEKYKASVITVTLDLGQQEDLEAVREKAERLGVERHYSIDAKDEFVRDYVFPAIKANALYEGKYPLATALSRPLIARKLVDIALKENATAVAHGCTGKGNDQVRLEIGVRALAPHLKVYAPVKEWGMDRASEIEYARRHGIPIGIKKHAYSIDQNLWGRSVECGIIEYPDQPPPEDAFTLTVPQERAPDKAETVTLGFKGSVPVALNGEKMDGVSLIRTLNKIAGAHGIGRIDHIEDRVVGIKSREVYEAPAAICILEAHKDLEKIVLTGMELRFKELVDSQWSYLAYAGLWFEPLKRSLDAFIEAMEGRVEGEVKLKLYKGSVMVQGRSSPFSLYDFDLATYDAKTTFKAWASEGFIELWGLPTVVAQRVLSRKPGGQKSSNESNRME